MTPHCLDRWQLHYHLGTLNVTKIGTHNWVGSDSLTGIYLDFHADFPKFYPLLPSSTRARVIFYENIIF